MISDDLKMKGHVYGEIIHSSGKKEYIDFPNTIVQTGRNAVAAMLANQIGSSFNLYVSSWIFGGSAVINGSSRYIPSSQNGLFGLTIATKPVIASVDPNISSQVIFTCTLGLNDAIGDINEMALVLATGDLYSMTTFGTLNKTNSMTITWSWRVSML